MKFPFIDGKADQPPEHEVDLPLQDREHQLDPAGYLMDEALAHAANVALLLGQPLLLTGEPGTGKTQLAYRVSWQLGLRRPLRFDTKSTSTARDLFYTFDTLRRFHAANTKSGSQNNVDYITFNALGRAILLSRDPKEVRHLLPAGFQHPGKRRSVVLIDEIDKAPRDFPNDLLNEVENMTFRVPELGEPERVPELGEPEIENAGVTADSKLRPVLILTSNSEKNLPDAFLRRCIYYHIPFPDRDRLAEIIRKRVPAYRDRTVRNVLLDSALEFFLRIRALELRKPPSTAELLNWLQSLDQWGASPGQKLEECEGPLKKSLSTLAKTREDLEELTRFVTDYLKER